MKWAENSKGSPVWPLAEVARTEATVTVKNLSGRFSTVPAGPWTDPPHTALVVPIRSNQAHKLAGGRQVARSKRRHVVPAEAYRSGKTILSNAHRLHLVESVTKAGILKTAQKWRRCLPSSSPLSGCTIAY